MAECKVTKKTIYEFFQFSNQKRPVNTDAFILPNNSNVNWSLVMYPKGRDNSNFVSIYLKCLMPKAPANQWVEAQFVFGIIDGNNRWLMAKQAEGRFTNKDQLLGCREFVSTEKIGSMLVDGTLRICVVLTILNASFEYRDVAETKLKLAEEKVRLAEERARIAEERAQLAEERARLAEERAVDRVPLQGNLIGCKNCN